MVEYIVKAKTKKEEKVVEAFLMSLEIDFITQAQEDEALYKVMQQDRKTPLLNKKQKQDFLEQIKSAK
jgi:hypothetical protein